MQERGMRERDIKIKEKGRELGINPSINSLKSDTYQVVLTFKLDSQMFKIGNISSIAHYLLAHIMDAIWANILVLQTQKRYSA